MSQVNAAAVHPYRRKVTLACGSCRKRRVKCSGNQPCALCSESGRLCEFDSKNRARRGPRPRQTSTIAQRVIHTLAPRIVPANLLEPVWHPHGEPERTAAEETERGVSDDDAEYDNGDLDGEIYVDGGGDDGHADDDDDADSTDEDDDEPDLSVWRPALEELLFRNKTLSKDSLLVSDIDLVCHLIHLFCTRATAQLRLMLPLAQIQEQLSRSTISRALVLAMCASAMRFSVHKAAKGTQARDFIEAVEIEARKCFRTSRLTWQQIDNVKTVCVLIDYEASRSYGRQAWVNIVMGRGLAQLARSASDLDAEQIRVLDVAERYLAITQTSHSLGHQHLQPRAGRIQKRPRIHCDPCPEDCPHLIELLEILASVHDLCLTPFREDRPPPWAPGSAFRALQDELEEYLLRHPVTFRFGANSPTDGLDTKRRRKAALEASISSMVWHCCVIALNRTFLPIPERRPWTEGAGGGKSESTVLHSVVEFPDAPPLFLNERVHRCESSADAICSISREVIRNQGFYSHAVLVGFACAQSALVSINRLHRSSKPYDDRVVENLKDAFIVLGAVQTFYAPAKQWMEAVLRAHDTNTTRLRHLDGAGSSNASFNSYFDRFLDLEEPPFMPLDPRETENASADARDADSNGKVVSATDETEARQDDAAPKDTSPVWLQAYADHLCEDIGIDNVDEHNSTNENSTGSTARDTEPLQPSQPVTSMLTHAMPVAAADASQGPEQSYTSIPPPITEDSVHMAGAILTSMSGGTPSFVFQAQEQMDINMHDSFAELFGQIPAFDMSTPSNLFMDLGAAGDANMWFEMMNQQMMK